MVIALTETRDSVVVDMADGMFESKVKETEVVYRFFKSLLISSCVARFRFSDAGVDGGVESTIMIGGADFDSVGSVGTLGAVE